MPGLWPEDGVVSMGPQFPVIWIMRSVNIAMLLLLTLILAACSEAIVDSDVGCGARALHHPGHLSPMITDR